MKYTLSDGQHCTIPYFVWIVFLCKRMFFYFIWGTVFKKDISSVGTIAFYCVSRIRIIDYHYISIVAIPCLKRIFVIAFCPKSCKKSIQFFVSVFFCLAYKFFLFTVGYYVNITKYNSSVSRDFSIFDIISSVFLLISGLLCWKNRFFEVNSESSTEKSLVKWYFEGKLSIRKVQYDAYGFLHFF